MKLNIHTAKYSEILLYVLNYMSYTYRHTSIPEVSVNVFGKSIAIHRADALGKIDVLEDVTILMGAYDTTYVGYVRTPEYEHNRQLGELYRDGGMIVKYGCKMVELIKGLYDIDLVTDEDRLDRDHIVQLIVNVMSEVCDATGRQLPTIKKSKTLSPYIPHR